MGCHILQKTCLKSTNSLRTQLLWSFGSSAFVSLAVVVILACTAALFAGRVVKSSASLLMREQVTDNLLTANKLVSEQFDAYMVQLEGTIQLIVEAGMDRIVGYPYSGWEEDRFVPFLDTDSQTRMYPLAQSPPPFEWNITPNVNPKTVNEHSPEREQWLLNFPKISTANGGYFMQGACDPSETNTSARTFYTNCTAANNNMETGGVVQPTLTNRVLHQKSGDLVVFLKALWESQPGALSGGYFFHNSGAGSYVMFPQYPISGHHPPYTSLGCEWMKNINPYTGDPFATEEEISRCHPEGTLVPQREYNPMERAWCQSFALNPHNVGWFGPFRKFDHGAEIMLVGRSIFDRLSGSFIGCVAVEISVGDMTSHMDSSVLNEHSELLLVRFNDGTLVSDSRNSEDLKHDEPLLKSLKIFQEAVNFEQQWTEEDAERAFQAITDTPDRGLLTAYPVPVIPDKYDPLYRPRFLVVHSISLEVFGVVDDINTSIDQGVQETCILAGGLAVFGMILVLCIVWCVSRMLTQPLLWMEGVAWRIVNHTDSRSGEALEMVEEEEKPATIRCGPETEVTQLVSEFRTMITSFSGEGASKVADSALYEIENDLTWHSDFQHLYLRLKQRPQPSSSATSDATDEESSALSSDVQQGILQRPLTEMAKRASMDDVAPLIVPPPAKRNCSNVISTLTKATTGRKDEDASALIRVHRSRLFWWIVVLIVIPLLILMGLICAIVSRNIVAIIPSWVEQADDASHQLALDALGLTAASKASLMTAVVFEAVRDLYLMTRVAGWLFFGGIKRSSAFTEMDTACEECKVYAKGACPYYTSNRTPCPCDWNDLLSETCTNYNLTESRNLQSQFWSLQSQDADPLTGRRNSFSSFPPVGSSPETTQWWSNASLLPGSDIGVQATGYATSYDRLRVSSAMAVAEFPVYNYAQHLGRKNHILGVFVGFEDDGLISGFKGCRYTHADYPFWNSTEENRAAVLAPSLCPIGKYGFDPRCRDWYTSGRDQYKSSSTPVHVTAPYQFASENEIATSATAPIANPQTGEYLGQTLLDFYSEGVKQGLEHLGDLIPILITPNVDVSGGDTVVGPNISSDWVSASIMDLLFEYDTAMASYRIQFEQGSLAAMKNGSSGLTDFRRTGQDGNSEHLVIAFAPVYERVLLPVSPDDFSRGAEVSQVLLYSVGIIRHAEDMRAPFQEIEYDMESQLDSIRTVYIVLAVVVAVLFTAFTCVITLYIVTPMISLLHVIQNINRRVVDNDFPPLQGGSREVHSVYNTFAKLYKVVRISNTAFFSGNLKWAYHFVNDALQLFRKVHDQKAVGIACNNLGNTLFAVHYDAVEDIGLDETGEESLIPLALRHYGEAIEIGQHQFDEAPDTELKVELALQLADRLFNRGLFLLLVDGEELAPEDARQQALHDIRCARNLDYDARDYMLEHKLLLKNSGAYFSRLLRRINGLSDFYDDIGLQEVWDVKELIDDADQLLFAAWHEPSAPLFGEVNRIGRLQQLEAAAIGLWLGMGNQIEAARLAMRMFSEDEHILELSFVRAADALLQVMREDNEGMSFSKKAVSCVRSDLRRMVKCCKNVSLDIGKCLVFAVEISGRLEGDPILDRMNANCLDLYDRHCTGNDYMGVVAYSTKETLTLEIGMKDGNEGRQHTLLDIATSSTAERVNPSFQIAVQMVVDSEASLENDSFIVTLLDGHTWDSDACSSLRMQVDRLNRERSTLIHLFIIGLDVTDPRAREQCKQLCTVSKLSMYADATLDTVDSIFDTIATAMSGRSLNNGFLRGITMERF